MYTGYGFFESKHALTNYHGEDLYAPVHFIVMGLILALIIVSCILLRKTPHEKITKAIKIFAIIAPILEIGKILWETHFDLKYGQGINWGGLMPFYTCSMLMFVLPFAAYGKGKVKKYALSFFTSIGIVAGMSNFVMLNVLRYFPMFTLSALYSVYYHAALVFLGLFFMTSGYYRPTFKDIFYAVIPVIAFAVIVVPVNFIIYYNTGDKWVDYLFLMHGNGTWIFGKVADFFEQHNLMLLTTPYMILCAYLPVSAIMSVLTQGVYKLVDLSKKAFKKN